MIPSPATDTKIFNFVITDRSLIKVSGPDAAHFFNNLITTDISALTLGEVKPGALLTPQGKILFDFLITPLTEKVESSEKTSANSFMIDIATVQAANFAKRLTLYKLRANVQISAPQQVLTLITGAITPELKTSNWTNIINNPSTGEKLLSVNDKRFPAELELKRSYYPIEALDIDQQTLRNNQSQWDELRITFAIPEGGSDFELGDNFPHDVNYDYLDGIVRQKGCYIGQEVISRMQHKAVIRKRLVKITAEQNLPPMGTEITLNDKVIGRLASVHGQSGLAIVRIDKLGQVETQQAAKVNDIVVSFIAPFYQPDMLAQFP